MSKMKAVVLEKSGSRYTVLSQDGTFRQVHRRLNAEVGEEVEIQLRREYFSGLRVWAGVAAMFLLIFTSLWGWNLYQAPTAVALLSVDINPSLQFELDAQGNLLKFQTQNEDAKRMLSQIDLKGRPIEEVLEQIVILAYDQKFLSSEQYWVVVGYSPMTNKTLEQMPKELNKNQIISWVTASSEKKGLTPQVAVFSLSSKEQELAQKEDLTLGEYALWQTADKIGVVTQPEKLKETSERVRLLENPQVQVQIKVEKNERRSVDMESIGKLDENGPGKHLPIGELISPNKGLYPWIDMSRGKDGAKYMPKDQRKDKYEQKDQDQDKDKNVQKDQDQDKYAQKDQDKDKNAQKDQDQEKYVQKDQDQDKNVQKDQDQDKYVQKDQDQDKYVQKDQDKDKYTQKDNDEQKVKDQEKYQNKAKDNELKEPRRTNDNIYVPSISTQGNSWSETSRYYKFPEYDRDKQQRR